MIILLLMLVCTWLRHFAATQWGSKKYEYENIHFLKKDKNILDKTHSSAHAGVGIPRIELPGNDVLQMAV